jgi:hypothetical protein
MRVEGYTNWTGSGPPSTDSRDPMKREPGRDGHRLRREVQSRPNS